MRSFFGLSPVSLLHVRLMLECIALLGWGVEEDEATPMTSEHEDVEQLGAAAGGKASIRSRG